MAKRTPRSQADDTSSMPTQPKSRRSRAGTAPEDTIGSYPGVERSEGDSTTAQPVSANQSRASKPIGSGPSVEDIRARAYQRYIERGGDHGTDFEDWLAAERELKGSKSAV
jgi:hypothetical protein